MSRELTHEEFWAREVYMDMQWRERALAIIPEIKEKIEALAPMIYPGHGYHYALLPDIEETEKQIKGLTKNSDFAFFIVAHVRLERIVEYVNKAEKRAQTLEEYRRDYG